MFSLSTAFLDYLNMLYAFFKSVESLPHKLVSHTHLLLAQLSPSVLLPQMESLTFGWPLPHIISTTEYMLIPLLPLQVSHPSGRLTGTTTQTVFCYSLAVCQFIPPHCSQKDLSEELRTPLKSSWQKPNIVQIWSPIISLVQNLCAFSSMQFAFWTFVNSPQSGPLPPSVSRSFSLKRCMANMIRGQLWTRRQRGDCQPICTYSCV